MRTQHIIFAHLCFCVYEASAHSYTLSILAFLDWYGTATVLIHLSTSVNASLIPYRSDPRPSILWGSFWNKLFRYSLVRSVCNVDRWIGTVPEQVWTQTVTYRSKLYRNSLYRYGIDPDMDRVINMITCILSLRHPGNNRSFHYCNDSASWAYMYY